MTTHTLPTTPSDRRTAAYDRQYDVIIIGGGIYGACMLLESARRNLRSILVERAEFGAATSDNSLRILHGGLRYLQTGDLVRFRQSVQERHWFMRNFSQWIAPRPCLMPLYGRGLRRRSVMGTALRLNDFLSRHRNRGLNGQMRLADSRLLTVEETDRRVSGLDRRRLRGAALWYDAFMMSPRIHPAGNYRVGGRARCRTARLGAG